MLSYTLSMYSYHFRKLRVAGLFHTSILLISELLNIRAGRSPNFSGPRHPLIWTRGYLWTSKSARAGSQL